MWLLPSRGRPASLARFIKAYADTNGSTPGMVLVDKADSHYHEYEALSQHFPIGWYLTPTRGKTQGDKIFEIWDQVKDCAWLGLIGDDCVPHTWEWDRKLVKALDGWNIVSCNDLWQAPRRLANCWVMSGNLVRTVGYIFPPGLDHLFVDDVWEDIGRSCRAWTCLMDVTVQHAHVLNGDAPADDTHRHVYGSDTSDPERGLWAGDRAAYDAWRLGDRQRVIGEIISHRPLLEAPSVPTPTAGPSVEDERLARARAKSVFIATPIARHPVRQYTNALARTVAVLTNLGMRCFIQNVVGSSNLPRARNELVAAFLASDYSDLLFVDDDMGWQPEAVVRLLASDKPVIGGIGCKKVEIADTNPEKWCIHTHRDDKFTQDEMGAIQVRGIGTGFLKIERSVFEKMVEAHPEWKRRGWPNMPEIASRWYYQFFRFPDDDSESGEDIEFCRQWAALGGEIWADPTIRLTHVGEKEYSGDFTAILQRAAE